MTYAHLDLEDLEQKLKESKANIKLIVTDGVFSMDAEVQRQHIHIQVIIVFVFSKKHHLFHHQVAPLPQLRELADQYGASICVDDSHSTGVWSSIKIFYLPH